MVAPGAGAGSVCYQFDGLAENGLLNILASLPVGGAAVLQVRRNTQSQLRMWVGLVAFFAEEILSYKESTLFRAAEHIAP